MPGTQSSGVKGGTFFYRVNDIFESWIDTENFHSLRFVRLLEEGTSDREQKYEIYSGPRPLR